MCCDGVEFKMSPHSCWGVFASTNSNLFSNHTFRESKLCSPKEICLAWGWKSRLESLHDDNGMNVGLLVPWVRAICEAAGHKIVFWSFYVKATWAEVLKASISRIPTGWKSLPCEAAQNNQHQRYSSSIKGQRWPATAGSVVASAQTRLGGDGRPQRRPECHWHLWAGAHLGALSIGQRNDPGTMSL